ncbi:MAG: hypothetical protein B9S32_00975 [Verrucomicrobia bacterium Tous-C9LFEB]|nr:MAG: hypothetical protein B9S32_00975 [Verrucomicrobia bacterium Tous-C9LFEB]
MVEYDFLFISGPIGKFLFRMINPSKISTDWSLVAMTSILILSGLTVLKAQTASSSSNSNRLRGFTANKLTPEVLVDARHTWNANSVRYMFPLDLVRRRDKLTLQQAWDKLIAELPAGLDEAKKNGLVLIIALPQQGILSDEPTTSVTDKQVRFWSDEASLKWMIECWKQVAILCAKRGDQEIWLDILNEPLNRKEFPAYPRQWPSWAQRMIDEIRKIDRIHPIVVEAGPGGLCWGFKDFPRMHGQPIIYSIHQYQPHAYTHQGITDLKNTDLAKAYMQLQRTWPGQFDEDRGYWNKERILDELEPVRIFQQRNPDARIYVGEFSAVRWAPNAAQYLRENIEIFEKYGWDWTYHAFREYNGWSLEMDSQYLGAQPPTPVEGLTDRGQVIMEFMKQNRGMK